MIDEKKEKSKVLNIELSKKFKYRFVSRITPKRMKLIRTVAKIRGGTISDFCRDAILKEARLELMRFRKDRVEMAKKILKEEEERKDNG